MSQPNPQAELHEWFEEQLDQFIKEVVPERMEESDVWQERTAGYNLARAQILDNIDKYKRKIQ